MKKSQSGFTLVELVVVILVLGILAATALPRFMNVTDQANTASVSGVKGGFAAGTALVKAQWFANGSNAAVSAVERFGNGNVSVNTSGWPVNTGGILISTGGHDVACKNVWEGILQNPPTIAVAVSGATVTTDYLVSAVTSSLTTSTLTGCTYQYQADTSKYIIYDANSGAVTISQ